MNSLDQSEIDYILFMEQEKQRKKDLKLSAIEKLQIIFKDTMNMDMEYSGDFETLDDIEAYIGLMEFEMKPNMQYYDDFMRLSHSFNMKKKNLD